MQDTNMTTPTSPFAPVDIPDINSVPVSGAMPPMNPAMAVESAPMPNPAIPVEPVPVAAPVASPVANATPTEVGMADIPEP